MYSNVARVARLCLIAIILTAAAAAPAKTSNSMVPSLHLCDEDFELNVSSSENSKEELKINLGPVKLQIQLTMANYKNQKYEELYEIIRIDDHQYISNWLPGQNDTNLVRRLVNANSQTVSMLNRLIESFVSDVFRVARPRVCRC
jgi:hypothetical protein